MEPVSKPHKQRLSITLDYTIIDEIKELAEMDDRSVSQYVNLILREHLNSLKKGKETFPPDNIKKYF